MMERHLYPARFHVWIKIGRCIKDRQFFGTIVDQDALSFEEPQAQNRRLGKLAVLAQGDPPRGKFDTANIVENAAIDRKRVNHEAGVFPSIASKVAGSLHLPGEADTFDSVQQVAAQVQPFL